LIPARGDLAGVAGYLAIVGRAGLATRAVVAGVGVETRVLPPGNGAGSLSMAFKRFPSSDPGRWGGQHLIERVALPNSSKAAMKAPRAYVTSSNSNRLEHELELSRL
jgi:hypothetical protein